MWHKRLYSRDCVVYVDVLVDWHFSDLISNRSPAHRVARRLNTDTKDNMWDDIHGAVVVTKLS